MALRSSSASDLCFVKFAFECTECVWKSFCQKSLSPFFLDPKQPSELFTSVLFNKLPFTNVYGSSFMTAFCMSSRRTELLNASAAPKYDLSLLMVLAAASSAAFFRWFASTSHSLKLKQFLRLKSLFSWITTPIFSACIASANDSTWFQSSPVSSTAQMLQSVFENFCTLTDGSSMWLIMLPGNLSSYVLSKLAQTFVVFPEKRQCKNL